MRFTRLKLSCWRNFPNVEIPLGERLLIFGPNGSGKSNLLDSLQFLFDLVSPGGGLWNAVQRRGSQYLRSLQAPAGHDIKIEVDLRINEEPWKYALSFAIDKQGEPRVRSEIVQRGRHKLLRRPEGDDRREPSRLTQTHLEQAGASASLLPLVEALRSAPMLRVQTSASALQQTILATPKRSREARLRRVLETVRGVWPRLERLSLEQEEQGRALQLIAKIDRGRAATRYPVELLSPGQIHLLSLLWNVSEGTGPLLLEDPERGLHPEVVGHLLSLLSMISSPPRQLLLCTHAERILDDNHVTPSEILLLHSSPDGTFVELAAEDTQVRSVAAEDGSLGPIIAARTGPSHDSQISLFFEPLE